MRLKPVAKFGILSVAVMVAGTWLATASLGPAKLETQLEMREIQEWGFLSGHSSVEVHFLRAWAPLYFEAKTSIHKVRHYDGDPPQGKSWTQTWGYEVTGAYLYTPWRVYLLRVIERSALPVEGENPAQKARDLQAKEDAARKRALGF
jgi:hypothetical protein